MMHASGFMIVWCILFRPKTSRVASVAIISWGISRAFFLSAVLTLSYAPYWCMPWIYRVKLSNYFRVRMYHLLLDIYPLRPRYHRCLNLVVLPRKRALWCPICWSFYTRWWVCSIVWVGAWTWASRSLLYLVMAGTRVRLYCFHIW